MNTSLGDTHQDTHGVCHRVRFAPSPTGHLHIGSARTALFNWLLARHEKGTFILRIEDTDRERSKPEYLESVLRDLEWLGLDWDEGPYHQSERLPLYHRYIDELLKAGKAYPCYCTPDELETKRQAMIAAKKPPGYDGQCRALNERERKAKEAQKAVIRFRSPDNKSLIVRDLIRGNVEFTEPLEDFVILKSDRYPVYNFACAIDDHLMEITDVLRGEEHLSNTPRQLLIYDAFGWTPPKFGHLPIILDEHRKKLSKREGATYLDEFRAAGFLPEALQNFIVLLGWAPKDDREIMPKAEIIDRFTVDGIGKSPAIFDLTKLEWMNGQYIKNLPTDKLIELVEPFLPPVPSREWLEKFVTLFHDRVRTLKQFADDGIYFLTDDYPIDANAAAELLTPAAAALLQELIAPLSQINFNPEELEKTVRSFSEEKKIKAAAIIHPLRAALTGKRVSPGIFQVMSLLGKEKVMDRIKGVGDRLQNRSLPPTGL